MPNHVTIEMTVSGDREAIMEFAESHFVANTNPDRNAWEDECFFEFSTIIPMPACMHGTTSPTPEADKLNARIRQKMYGASNWYDWSINNWGTKWGAYDVDANFDRVELDGCAVVRFQTAWSLPEPIFAELADLYPELTFEIRCCEEGGFFAGELTYTGGEVIDNLVGEEGWDMYAAEFYGYDLDEDGKIIYD